MQDVRPPSRRPKGNLWFDALEEPLHLQYEAGSVLATILAGRRATFEIFRGTPPGFTDAQVASVLAHLQAKDGVVPGPLPDSHPTDEAEYTRVVNQQSELLQGLTMRANSVAYRLVLTRNRDPIGVFAFSWSALADSKKMFAANAFVLDVHDAWIARTYRKRGFDADMAEVACLLVYRALLELDSRLGAARAKRVEAKISVKFDAQDDARLALPRQLLRKLQELVDGAAELPDPSAEKLKKIVVSRVEASPRQVATCLPRQVA